MKDQTITDGVVAEKDGEYWGCQYSDGQVTEMGFGPLMNADISDPQYCKDPTYKTNKNNVRHYNQLKYARLVKVKKTITVEIVPQPTASSKVSVDTYRDGGTVCISDGDVKFCIDHRIGTQTKDSLYDDYPTKGNIVFKKEDFSLFLDMVGRIDYDVSENESIRIEMMIEQIGKLKLMIDHAPCHSTRLPSRHRNSDMVITRDKCSYADKYKGIRKPTCGCRACLKIWKEAKTAGSNPTALTIFI